MRIQPALIATFLSYIHPNIVWCSASCYADFEKYPWPSVKLSNTNSFR